MIARVAVAIGLIAGLQIAAVSAAASPATMPSAVAQQVMSPDQLFAATSDSVFMVQIQLKNPDLFTQGSGFLVSNDGLLVTNFHVIRNGATGWVQTADGQKKYSITGVVGTDRINDLALLQTDVKGAALAIGPDEAPVIGTRVYAIGSPQGFANTLSEGLISGVRAENIFTPLLQTTVPISPGSSGSPLFTASGKVAGVIKACWMDGQNINFAVPASKVRQLMAKRGEAVSLLVAAAPMSLEDQLALNQCWCDLLQKQYVSAAILLNDLKDRQSSHSLFWYMAGYLQEQDRHFQAAIGDYQKALQLKPQNPGGVYLRLGTCYIGQRNFQAAIDALRNCVRIDPGNVQAWQSAAVAFEDIGKPRHAIDVVQKAIHLDPKNPRWYSIVGSCYLRLKQYPDAAHSYQQCAQLSPSDPISWLLLAKAHLGERDLQAARVDFDRVVQLDPDGLWGATARSSLQHLDAAGAPYASVDLRQ
jgi:tetratricopeptide (TPR) repeat protein